MQISTQRLFRLAALAPLLALAGCGEGSGQTASVGNLAAATDSAAAETAASCAACHTGNLSFSGRDPEELAGLIQAIAAGDRAHPPVSLPSTDGDSVKALAKALTGN